ncbi:MAG TPA: HAD-IC family P-type ATPase [Gaiellales bacterium]|nr:HAD-IC family P-type ATPase [Gaiellales bacterium]
MSTYGLTSAEAARRLEERPAHPAASGLTYRAIVRRNLLTLFNFVLAACAVALIATGQLADLLFAGVLIVNSGIGIVQEVRAKRALDRLALLAAPRARVLRDGGEREVSVDDVVAGDAIVLRPGDQVVADGRLLEARGLQVDESILTGESDPDARRAGDSLQSGSFCVAGSGIYEAERVGSDAYANELTGVAREDTRELSPLQLSINRLLRLMVALMVPISALLLYALHVHAVPAQEAVSTAVAGIVSLVPEGLVLLASLVFAVAAARVGRRGALVQRLPAVEALAGLDIVCLDKTGTLTDGTLAVEEILPVSGADGREVHGLLGRFAASLGSRNPTADALHGQLGGSPRPVTLEVPFSSRWKWSGIAFGDGTELVLGAPEVIVRPESDPALAHEVGARQHRRLRVLLFARTAGLAEPEGDGEPWLPSLTPLAIVALSERMRPDAATTVAYLHRTGVHVKIISGDGPATVAAVARAAGIDTDGRVTTGAELPQDAGALRRSAVDNAVFARVQPEDKRQLVAALRRGGRRVGMIGDGVNDVPALKECDVAIALGSGSQLAKGVSDVVLVSESFESIPFAIEEGRKILRNVQRVAKLFVAKSVFAAVLILTVGVGGGTYPFLPRQLSLAAAVTVGIPAFFLALAPAAQAPPKPFLRDVAEFAIPAGLILGVAVLLGHGLVHTSVGRSAAESQTTSLTILVFVGLYLVLVLESGSMRRSRLRGALVPLLVGALGISYLIILSFRSTRSAFALGTPSGLPLVVSVICTTFAIGALGMLGLSLTRPGGEQVQVVRFWRRKARAG